MITLVRAGSVDGMGPADRGGGRGVAFGGDAMRPRCCTFCICRIRRSAGVMPSRLAEELAQFERPMPVMDEYDLLLADATGGIQ